MNESHCWYERNQTHVVAALAGVRLALESHATKLEPKPLPVASQPQLVPEVDFKPALEELCSVFGLSLFERSVVLLCAGMELCGDWSKLCARAQGNEDHGFPTFGLALAALPEPHWSAILPTGPLRRWRLVDLSEPAALTSSSLRLPERVLHYLAGFEHVDEQLWGLIDPVDHCHPLSPSQHEVARLAARRIAAGNGSKLVVQLAGQDPEAKTAVALAASQLAGMRLVSLTADALPANAHDVDIFVRTWEREARLGRYALIVDCDSHDRAAGVNAVDRMIDRLHGLVFVPSRERRRQFTSPMLYLEVRRPTKPEQQCLWREGLGAFEDLNGHVELLSSQFDIGAAAIRSVCADVRAECESGHEHEVQRASWESCRQHARTGLDDLAALIDAQAEWDDLILPAEQKDTLRSILAHVTHRNQVYETWAFARRNRRGLGIGALFAGASGTGKTMAAEVLAKELSLDLYRIDLSSVVSKYIGETEKNLKRVFDAAEESGAILLFDEADALFGKRSEVKDSHDRYANIEVSYLLQRMECYRGLAILTTNLKSALDAAFLRRLRFVVHFPFPNADEREQIWRRVFPSDAPTKGLDPSKLARLDIAGGNIRNIALHAAFLAADECCPIEMRHALSAARMEYGKLERTLTESEVIGWLSPED